MGRRAARHLSPAASGAPPLNRLNSPVPREAGGDGVCPCGQDCSAVPSGAPGKLLSMWETPVRRALLSITMLSLVACGVVPRQG